jgi:hypothetical protein
MHHKARYVVSGGYEKKGAIAPFLGTFSYI